LNIEKLLLVRVKINMPHALLYKSNVSYPKCILFYKHHGNNIMCYIYFHSSGTSCLRTSITGVNALTLITFCHYSCDHDYDQYAWSLRSPQHHHYIVKCTTHLFCSKHRCSLLPPRYHHHLQHRHHLLLLFSRPSVSHPKPKINLAMQNLKKQAV